MNKSFCDSHKDTFFGCKYCRKTFDTRGTGKLYHACFFLPYWGKPLDTIKKCPRFNWDGTENPWTLRSVCVESK